MKKIIFAGLISIFLSGLTVTLSAQAQTKKANERPAAGPSQKSTKANYTPTYFYEFTQPDFVVSKVVIEHDDAGRGQISFMKSISDETISDPIEISAAALEKINQALTALDYFESTENYQYEKDYSHLGNIRIKVKKGGKERETKFNYTQNASARALSEEYRKISNQHIWVFDMKLSRENQPLEAPKLMDALDSYHRRNELSDIAQLVPFLKELSDDERIPLIARNHAARIVKMIEKDAGRK